MNKTRKTTLLIVIGLAALGALAIYWNSKQAPSAASSDASARMKRLFLENHSEDDYDREVFFPVFLESLYKKGYRCDKVERMMKDQTQQSPGAIWRVSCSPGYRYTFFFNADGLPTHVRTE
jgi:hypothetical protein